MKKKQSRYGKYYATSQDMETLWEHKDNGLFVEYNPNVHMWRINSSSKRGIPEHLMGYSPHPKVLKSQISKYRG